MTRIMFVCHGNICRSPMAEMIFKDLLKKAGLKHRFFVASCATSTEEIVNGIGNPIYPPALAELKKHGIPAENRHAVQLKRKDYRDYDLFIAMDDRNLKNMMRIFGTDNENKLHRLMDYTDTPGEVSDPWYTGRFDIAFLDIYKGCSALLEHLISSFSE